MHPSHRRIVAAIPARYASTRLPGKPLWPLAGRPMIEHVWRRVTAASGLDRVVVLTDDERIAAVVQHFGGEAEMTPPECSSGTDRIAWAARNWDGVDAVLNVQGDEPLIDPAGISSLAAHFAAAPGEEMATLAAPAEEGDLENPNAVKVVCDLEGYALYFSRSPIPHPRHPGQAVVWKHLGIYGYRPATLQRLAALAPTQLERSESLEQLRALEHGIRIRVLQTQRTSFGVDTREDAERVETMMTTSMLETIAT